MKAVSPASLIRLQGIVAMAAVALFLGSCNRSKPDASTPESAETQTSQSATTNTTTQPTNSDEVESQSSLTTNPEDTAAENTAENEFENPAEDLAKNLTPEDDFSEEAEIIELPDFEDEPSADLEATEDIEFDISEELEVEETQPETTEESSELEKTASRSTLEKPSIDVGTFDFQLRETSLETEIIDRASNKRLSTENADEPSSYLFVELDLKNNSNETIWDSVLYTLECEGRLIENAADVARVYRSNRNIKISSEIQPGGKGLVADAFLVSEYCLKSNDLNLVVSPVGEGKAVIPLNLN